MRYALIALLAWTTSVCHAQLILPPEGLEPGDQYRLIFTTSQKRDATSSNIEDYNNFVQSVADSSPEVASWGLEWKAVAATMEVDARTNTGLVVDESSEIPVYRIDGMRMADNYALFWRLENNFLSVAPNVDELGEVVVDSDFTDQDDNVLAWTGTGSDGKVIRPTHTLGQAQAFVGIANSSSSDTWSWSARIATVQRPMYAVSELITIVPEPGYFDLQTLALAGIVFFRMGRRLDERRSQSAVCEQLLQPSCGTNTAGAV